MISRKRQKHKRSRRHRRRTQRGGGRINYTKCGAACPYFSKTPQYSGGGKKKRRRTRRRGKLRVRRRRSTRHRYISRYRRRALRGGELIKIKQILLTKSVRDAVGEFVKGLKKNAPKSWPMKDPSEYDDLSGAPSMKMTKIGKHLTKPDGLVHAPAIEVKKAMRNGKPMVTQFLPDKKHVQLYRIINGRHRFARAIAEGLTHIDAKVFA